MTSSDPPPPPPPHPPGHGAYPQPHAHPPYGDAPYGPAPYAFAPAGPAPGLRYAGFWIRFLAVFIDSIILAIPFGILALALIVPNVVSLQCTTTTDQFGIPVTTCPGLVTLSYIFAGVGLVLQVAYFVILWSWQGQTLGQKICGLRVVDANTGGRIGPGRALGRFVGYVISAWVVYIGLIWAAFDSRKQGWHDKMASTFVVRRA